MAYIRPLVMVFQEYANMSTSTQTATLTPCIVGPCYHIIDPDTDETLSLVGTYTKEGFDTKSFPNNKPGALIQEDSVTVRLKNPIVAMAASPATVASISANKITFTAGNFPAYAAVGDYVRVVDTTVPDSLVTIYGGARVIAVDAATYTLSINKSVVTAVTNLGAEITRKVDDITLPATSTFLTVDATDETFDLVGVTISVAGSARTVTQAEAYVGYKALRQDLSSGVTLYTVDEAKAALGSLVPENPLGYGILITLANTSVGVRAFGVDSDDLEGYTAVKDRLETIDNVYAIVPLTQEAEILSMFKTHAVEMSQPAKGMWRVALGNTKLQTTKVLATGNGKVGVDGSSDRVVFTDLEATFLSDSVDAGDILYVKGSGGTEIMHTIASVASDDILTITKTPAFSLVEFPSTDTNYDYRIVRSLDKTSQARAIADTSKSFGTARFVHVWPDVAVIDDVELPGYYNACTIAGMTGGLPSHQGFTRISVAGIGGLKHSNDYFNQEQLDIIAGGGTFIFTQLTPESAPYVRHQLTTDMSTTELREFSFVKNYDYVCYILKDVLDQFLGQWNITPFTLGVLETSIRATLESLKLYSVAKIGSPVLQYEVTSVKQLADVKDRVEAYANVWFPYALNTIGMHIISQ